MHIHVCTCIMKPNYFLCLKIQVSNEQAITFALLQSNMRSWFGCIVIQIMIYFQCINWHLLGLLGIYMRWSLTTRHWRKQRSWEVDWQISVPDLHFYNWDFQLTRICQEFYATLVSLDTSRSSSATGIQQMCDRDPGKVHSLHYYQRIINNVHCRANERNEWPYSNFKFQMFDVCCCLHHFHLNFKEPYLFFRMKKCTS